MSETSDSEPVRAWDHVKSEGQPSLVIFRPRFDWMRNPRTNEVLKRLVLETAEWVNIVALTKERELVLVRQYRFGSAAVSTEIPGGVVDPGEQHEVAARRELREETGHTSARWTYLGAVEPNPAFHDNICHHWLAEDAERTHPQELDEGEDIEITTLPVDAVLRAIREGDIRHSLVLCALARVFDLSAAAPAPKPSEPA